MDGFGGMHAVKEYTITFIVVAMCVHQGSICDRICENLADIHVITRFS